MNCGERGRARERERESKRDGVCGYDVARVSLELVGHLTRGSLELCHVLLVYCASSRSVGPLNITLRCS
jgi:hypothetical protein